MTSEQHNYMQRTASWFDQSHEFDFRTYCVALGFVGSHSHGTYVPPSDPDAIDDVDLMGVVLPPASHLLGLKSFTHWTCQRDELDIVAYSMHRLVELLVKGNPNVVGLLWLRPEDYLHRGRPFDRLQEARDLFSSKAMHTSFAGYAAGQLHRMTSYSRDIQDEIDNLTRALSDAGWYVSEIMDRRPLPMPRGITPAEANAKADRLRSLRAKYHAAYMGEKRRRLVVQHGYDTKNAAHLIRLLRMCVEFFDTGLLNVYRTHDADDLRAIKRGERTLESVKAEAERLFADAQKARDSSALPEQPNRNAVNDLIVGIVRDWIA